MLWNKVVNVHPFFTEVHGNTTTVGELTIVYGFGLLVGTSLLYITDKETKQRPLSAKSLKTWQKVLLFTVGVDIAGGVLANLTKGTSNFYAKKGKYFAFGFIAIHFLQPLLIYLSFKRDEITDEEIETKFAQEKRENTNTSKPRILRRRSSQMENFGVEVDNECLKEYLFKCYLYQLFSSSLNIYLWGNKKFENTNNIIGLTTLLLGFFGLQFEYFTDYIDRKSIQYLMQLYFTKLIFSFSIDHYNSYNKE